MKAQFRTRLPSAGHRSPLAFAAWTACAWILTATTALSQGPPKPNVLIVLLDDVGTDSLSMFDEVNPYQSDMPYMHGTVGDGDAPANGQGTSNLYVNSPSLQQLADEGVTFYNA